MDDATRSSLEGLRSGDKGRQDAAFAHLIAATEVPVPWASQAWADILGLLAHPSNRTRAIASQVLCNLAKSDPDGRIVDDFDALLAVTRDERFVTARHCLQSLWRVGVAGPSQLQRLLAGLETRYRECGTEKNCTLIRFDIITSLRKVFEETQDDSVRAKALELIALEDDLKYRKKYGRVWPER